LNPFSIFSLCLLISSISLSIFCSKPSVSSSKCFSRTFQRADDISPPQNAQFFRLFLWSSHPSLTHLFKAYSNSNSCIFSESPIFFSTISFILSEKDWNSNVIVGSGEILGLGISLRLCSNSCLSLSPIDIYEGDRTI